MTCKDCIHWEACSYKLPFYQVERLEPCARHKDKSLYIKMPCAVEPIVSVNRKEFHNRIEVVKNIRYEWNEARFCFSKDEADRVETEWKGE